MPVEANPTAESQMLRFVDAQRTGRLTADLLPGAVSPAARATRSCWPHCDQQHKETAPQVQSKSAEALQTFCRQLGCAHVLVLALSIMDRLQEALSRSTAGTRLLKLLLGVERDRDQIAGAIVDVLREQGA